MDIWLRFKRRGIIQKAHCQMQENRVPIHVKPILFLFFDILKGKY